MIAPHAGFRSPAGDLIVQVKGLRNSTGQVGILVFRSAEGFPGDREKSVYQVLLPIRQGRVEHRVAGLKSGSYAVVVMHDENANRRMDTNFLGIPKEGFGVSNDAVRKLGAPVFRESAFPFSGEEKSVSITVTYW